MATYRIYFSASGGKVICTTNTDRGVTSDVDENNRLYVQNDQATQLPVVRLVQDLTGRVTVDDSFGLEIAWGNVNTYVLFMPNYTTTSSAIWKYNNIQITGSDKTNLPNWATVTVSSNDVQSGHKGNNVTNVQVSTKANLSNPPYNNPAYVNNGAIALVNGKPVKNYGVSWTAPTDDEDLLYYLVLEHKGDHWGQSDGYAVGGVGIVTKDRQGYTNTASWWSGTTGFHVKITIHAIYKGGAVPSLVNLPDNVAADREKNTTNDYAAWIRFARPPADDPSYFIVSFLDEDKTTVLESIDGRPYETSYQQGAPIRKNQPSPSEICPQGKGLKGWLRKVGNGSWETTVYTQDQVAEHVVNSNIDYAAVYYDLGSIYIYANGKWNLGTPYIKTASGWVQGIAYINNGTTWRKGGSA